MYQKLSESTESLLAYKITSKLTEGEMKQITKEIEQAIANVGKIRMLIDLRAFPYADLKALWEDFKFDIKHAKDIKRLAIIGDRTWEEWGTKLFDKLASTECRYFEHAEIDQAWRWLTE